MKLMTVGDFLRRDSLRPAIHRTDYFYKILLKGCRSGVTQRSRGAYGKYMYDEAFMQAAYDACIAGNLRVDSFLRDWKQAHKGKAEELLNEVEPNLPEGYITTRGFCLKYTEFQPENLTRLASSLYAAGVIEREFVAGNKNRVCYREADLLEIATNDKQRREQGQLKQFRKHVERPEELPLEPQTEAPQPVLTTPEPQQPVAPRIEYTPGIFVRIWRWLFGHRKEVQP